MDQVVILAGAAIAVATLVALCWLIGFRTSVKIADEAHARALVSAENPGASIAHVFVDAKGRAALAQLGDGRIAVIRAMGDRFAIRTAPQKSVRVHVRGNGGMRLAWADIGFPPLRLKYGPEGLPDWLAGRTSG